MVFPRNDGSFVIVKLVAVTDTVEVPSVTVPVQVRVPLTVAIGPICPEVSSASAATAAIGHRHGRPTQSSANAGDSVPVTAQSSELAVLP